MISNCLRIRRIVVWRVETRNIVRVGFDVILLPSVGEPRIVECESQLSSISSEMNDLRGRS